MNITFKRDQPIIFSWPSELHTQEFWDTKDKPKKIIYTFVSISSNKALV